MEAAQSALEAGSWQLARTEFLAIAEASEDPLASEGLAQAAWWLDDGDTCVGEREKAYRRYRELGDSFGAARAATALAWDSLLFGHGDSVALGWWGRAGLLLEGLEESVEHGWHAVREAELAIEVWHDPKRALAAGERAAAIAKRLGREDLAVVGLALQGLAMTNAGDVLEGMASLDASVAAATSGDVPDPMWMGKVCCWLILACNQNKDIARASDWCRRVEAICAERDLAPLFNVCHIQHASVQVASGEWQEAEQELTGVLQRLSGSRRLSRLEAVVQLGELRRRQGRLEEAEALFAQAEFHPFAIVGRAQLHIADADWESAWSALRGLLERIPTTSRLIRAEVLLPAVLTARAIGEEEASREFAAELRDTAESTGLPSLMATASVADAALAEPNVAIGLLIDAVERFSAAGLRFDEARTRLSLAETLLTTGDRSSARHHLAIATLVLTELSAASDLLRARQLVDAMELPANGPQAHNVLSARECEVLRLVAQGLSNRSIAAKLILSEHTVHRHVANILTKLGQTSRTGAASYGIQEGLI